MQDDSADIEVTRQRAPGALVVFAAAVMLLGPGTARAQTDPGPDTLSLRIETGAGTDITNEQYYEDAFVDTTFLARRRVSTPETRYAGILLTALEGTRGDRRAAYQIQNELSLGDNLQRNTLALNWRDDFAPAWRWSFNPTLEWRHDQTFDRDQEEWRASGRARLRRGFIEATTTELGLTGDILRTSGEGSEFLLDRNAARASIALDHLGLMGDEWRLGYGLAMRVFPDSSVRDHLEHGWEGRWRHAFEAGHALAVETNGMRRLTRTAVPTSRDNFWDEFATLDGEIRTAERWAVKARVEGEALQYDVPDSAVYFNYQLARGRIGLRFESGGRWTVTLGPRAELLASGLNPGEAYRELGGGLEIESVSARSVWNLSPAAGWRAYDQASGAVGSTALHSSFAFYELDGFLDHALLERLRLRALGSMRYEFHTDDSQDSGSLYVSLQLRWLAHS